MVRFTSWVIRRRWLVIAASLGVTVLCVLGMGRLSLSNNYRVFFSDQNPQLRAFEALERIYTKNDSILFVLQPEGRDVFTPEVLRIVHELTEHAWQVPFSTRVDSVTNFQHTRAEEDDLVVEDLVPDPGSLDAAGAARVRAIALAEPLLNGLLVAADGATTGVNVRIHPPGKSRREISEAVAYARGMMAELRAKHPDLRVELTGTTMLSNAFAEAPEEDVRFLLPLMYAVLLAMMLYLLRSVAGAVVTFSVIALSALSAMGFAGWLGMQLNGVSVSAPTIILTLAIADSVHILVTMFGEMMRGRDKRAALIESMRINAQPVFLTSLTTVIGFLSLNFSDAPPLRDLGNITAVGVALAWVYSVTFLPALVAVLPVNPHRAKVMSTTAMEGLAEFVIRNRRRLLYGMSALALALSAGMLRFEINDRPAEYFDESIEFRRATDFAIDNLSGFYGMNFSLDAGESGGISNPGYLKVVSDFVDWMRARPDVAHVTTITDTMKRLNKSMHGDDPAYYRLPDDRELAAQYLLLYEMSVPFGLDLNDQINVDKSATRLTVTNADIDFRRLKEFKVEAEAWLAQHGLPSMRDAQGSSPAVMFAFIGQRNVEAMVQGTAVAFALISLVLIVTLRSVRIGVISIIPNVVPISMAFGIWALLFRQADFAISIVAGVSVGIIVDDTIHFLAKYLRGRREQGLGSADAVRYAFRTVGNALWANSLILVFGFTALAWSNFWPNATMGLLTAVAIGVALVADFFLLPPLLMWLDGDETR
jgi:predicted RND superfamily exporter protein